MGVEGDEVSEVLMIKLMDQIGQIEFKVKKTTLMSKIFKSFYDKRGIQHGSVKFMFDGLSVHESSTPKTMEMEDGDQIDIMQFQTGGRGINYV
jgi:hypothetical protein